MKSQLLSIAIASTAVLPAIATANGPIEGSVYGKVNVSLVNSDSGSNDQWQLNSNASRVGIKGKTELSTDLFALYKAEFEIAVDDGDNKGQTFSQRNIIAGIQGNFGTVWAGKHDTPTKTAQNKIDVFNDLEGDIKHTFKGEVRASNIIAYTTPNLQGFSATVAAIPGEGSVSNGERQNGIADGVSVALSYTYEDLYVALAADDDVSGIDSLRLIGKYTLNELTVGFMYQQSEDAFNSANLDQRGFLVSAAYKIDKTTLKLQYGNNEDDGGNAVFDEHDTLSVGVDYELAKNTNLFGFYTENSSSANGSAGDDEEENTYGIGMAHKF